MAPAGITGRMNTATGYAAILIQTVMAAKQRTMTVHAMSIGAVEQLRGTCLMIKKGMVK